MPDIALVAFIMFVILVAAGASTGWVAGLTREHYGFGLIGNIAIGIIGALISGWLFAKANYYPVAFFWLRLTILYAAVGAIAGAAAGLNLKRLGRIGATGAIVSLILIGIIFFPSPIRFPVGPVVGTSAIVLAIVLIGAFAGWGWGQYNRYLIGPDSIGVIGTVIAIAFFSTMIIFLFWLHVLGAGRFVVFPIIGLVPTQDVVMGVIGAILGGGYLLLLVGWLTVLASWLTQKPKKEFSGTRSDA